MPVVDGGQPLGSSFLVILAGHPGVQSRAPALPADRSFSPLIGLLIGSESQ